MSPDGVTHVPGRICHPCSRSGAPKRGPLPHDFGRLAAQGGAETAPRATETQPRATGTKIPRYRDSTPCYRDSTPRYRDSTPRYRDSTPRCGDATPCSDDAPPRSDDETPCSDDEIPSDPKVYPSSPRYPRRRGSGRKRAGFSPGRPLQPICLCNTTYSVGLCERIAFLRGAFASSGFLPLDLSLLHRPRLRSSPRPAVEPARPPRARA
jgi:hypothetical protein